jgi:hypothetical protein
MAEKDILDIISRLRTHYISGILKDRNVDAVKILDELIELINDYKENPRDCNGIIIKEGMKVKILPKLSVCASMAKCGYVVKHPVYNLVVLVELNSGDLIPFIINCNNAKGMEVINES